MPSFFRSDQFVKSTLGPAVPGAQVFVCTQPANVPTGLTALVPTPTPLATIYSDPDGLVPITQPIITDGFGHADFYVAPGTYDVSVYLSGTLQQEYPDQSIGLGTQSDALTPSNIAAGSNMTITTVDGVTTFAASGGGGGSFQTTTVTLTAAQVKLLGTTPIQIIAAPGSGKVTAVVSSFFQVKQGGVTFDIGLGGTPSYFLQYGNLTDLSATSISSFGGADVSDPTGQIAINGNYQFVGVTVPALITNLPVYIWNANGPTTDPTVGNGTFIFTIIYYTQTLA